MIKLQKILHVRILQNGKMCKDKGNELNSYYKKLLDYHKGISHHMSLWEMILEEWDRYHLPRESNKEFYEAIKAFQSKWIINVLIRMKDLQAEGDGNFVTSMFETNTQEEQDFAQHRYFTKELLGDDNIIEEQLPNEYCIVSVWEKTNIVNLDEFASNL